MRLLPLAYTGRARALAGLKEYEAAIEDFKKVTDINKDYVPALVSRGEMYLEIGAADRRCPTSRRPSKPSART